jgi:hypothetical protein
MLIARAKQDMRSTLVTSHNKHILCKGVNPYLAQSFSSFRD